MEEEQEKDEEEMIEKFFSIIRRFCDACGHSMNSLHQRKKTTNTQQVRKKPKIQHESVWTPTNQSKSNHLSVRNIFLSCLILD